MYEQVHISILLLKYFKSNGGIAFRSALHKAFGLICAMFALIIACG